MRIRLGILVAAFLWVLPMGAAAQRLGALRGDLVFVRLTDGFWQLWQHELESGEERQLTSSEFDKRYPEWDESGNVYFRNNNDEVFRLANRVGAVAEPFAPEAWPALDPVSGPRGLGVALIRLRTDLSDASALYLVDRSGDHLRLLTPGPGLRMHPSWQPDGSAIAYVSSTQGSRSEIRLVNASGIDSVSLVGADAMNLHPAYSPTSGDLAYASNRSGSFDIWLRRSIDAGASGDLRLTKTAAMGPSRHGRQMARALPIRPIERFGFRSGS